MILFGHLGIGNALAAPFRRGLRRRWILLGTLMPDLIDKPLYYGLSFATGKRGAELGLISGTRTFGHTALLLLALGAYALTKKSRIAAALMLGMATHLLLDRIGEEYFRTGDVSALFWPFVSRSFPVMPFRDAHEHMASWSNPFLIGAEIVGALLLGWDFWKRRHRTEILAETAKVRASSNGRRSRSAR